VAFIYTFVTVKNRHSADFDRSVWGIPRQKSRAWSAPVILICKVMQYSRRWSFCLPENRNGGNTTLYNWECICVRRIYPQISYEPKYPPTYKPIIISHHGIQPPCSLGQLVGEATPKFRNWLPDVCPPSQHHFNCCGSKPRDRSYVSPFVKTCRHPKRRSISYRSPVSLLRQAYRGRECI